jgi:hypothetical protein
MKNFENITIKNKHGQELDFDVVTNYIMVFLAGIMRVKLMIF